MTVTFEHNLNGIRRMRQHVQQEALLLQTDHAMHLSAEILQTTKHPISKKIAIDK